MVGRSFASLFFGFLVWIPFNSHRSVHSFSCGFLSPPPCMLLSFPWRLHYTRLFCEHLQHSFVYFVFVFLHRISSTYNRRMGVLRRRCLFIFSPFSVEKIVLKELWSKSQKELHFQPSTLSKHLCSRLRSVLWGPAEQVFFHIFTSYGVSSSTIFRTIQYIFFSFVWRAENMYRGKNSGYSNGNGTFIWCHLSCVRSKETYVSVKIEMDKLWFLTAKIVRI